MYVSFSREQIVYPFVVVNQLGKYDVAAHVHGGGISGRCSGTCI